MRARGLTLTRTGLHIAWLTTACLQWTGIANGDEALQELASDTALYIAMPDGTRLAADVWLPAQVPRNERIPTIVMFTRYWRAELRDPPQTQPPDTVSRMNGAGYAVVMVDTRGSGASFGSRAAELSTCETRDFKEVIDWIADQKWSNGKVATFGTSYVGNTAENATFSPSHALVASVARFTDFDWYTSLVFPGGLPNRIIIEDWGHEARELDRNIVSDPQSPDGGRVLGVKPVDVDVSRTLLSSAVAQHAANIDVTAELERVQSRDDVPVAQDLRQPCEYAVTPYMFRAAAERAAIPTFHWGSWMDAGTAAGVLARFVTYKSPNRYVIGAWTHGAAYNADPLSSRDSPVVPVKDEQFAQVFAFLRPYMFGTSSQEEKRPEPELVYYTMGEGAWKHTAVWPPAGARKQRWYLSPEGLVADRPNDSSVGADRYRVNYDAGTGIRTRWTTQMGGDPVDYGNRETADRLLLTYTSQPLTRDLEVTGQPLLDLFLSSSATDGALIAYFELVDAQGAVRMITEGELRLQYRERSSIHPGYAPFGPYRTFTRASIRAMVPGKIERIPLAMLPTSVLVRAGTRIRLAIAGADKDTFARVPISGAPVLTVYRGAGHLSSFELPIVDGGRP